MDSVEYEHRCESMPSDGVFVHRSKYWDEDSSWEWNLIIQRCADESDLDENHYLEEVGDIIWYTVVGISHCPFCGKNLESSGLQSGDREAEFKHVDSSGWSSREM